MKLIMTLITCCLIIAAARLAIAAFAMAILFTLIWGLYKRTAQTVGYLLTCAMVWFASAQPKWALAATMTTLAIIAVRWANHLKSDLVIRRERDR